MNIDLWDIDDSQVFAKQFSVSDPHDPMLYDEFLEDVPFEDDGDEPLCEADPFDWFNERDSKEYDV